MKAHTGPDEPDELDGPAAEEKGGDSSEEPESDWLKEFGKVHL